jgi:hypothetical protein
MSKQLTITQLKKLCDNEIKKGDGNRMIVISDDNEGNGYHGLFFGFTTIATDEKDFFPISDSVSEDINKIIILG